MADNIKVEPTPIQRNRRDIAFELLSLRLHYDRNRADYTEDQIVALYNKFYANAAVIENESVEDLKKYL
ncbi:hypothetical protein [Clostridium beijerinckii]|uniref:hypothetical protein n=1 Tax=Clostridium beijerinckii TaxID=1520 RepID=UPI00098C1795|nr:hypothetical protein [Clostridium beijerinckii]MBA8935812.1 hypothetical protein [Clostridium beijerinckii]NRU40206.1 hypothetical protein [Clostridium beijerinckii]NSA96516.1 hypothetical protein [Clostridium beijerinckii]OOM53210.1 hypothetical protein CLOBI_51060 [Clostridium beijerinckii]OOM70333.1 hypothetical protein CLBEIC_19970 [Clostridium beijerinckii]